MLPLLVESRNESTNYNQWEKMETIDFPYIYCTVLGLTATTASPMAGYGRGHSFFLKMAMVAEF